MVCPACIPQHGTGISSSPSPDFRSHRSACTRSAPAVKGGVGKHDSTAGQHALKIGIADRELQIPANRLQDPLGESAEAKAPMPSVKFCNGIPTTKKLMVPRPTFPKWADSEGHRRTTVP